MKFKDKWKEMVLIICTALLIILTVISIIFGKSKQKDIFALKKEYESYNGQNVREELKYIDVNIPLSTNLQILSESEVIKKLDNETGIFYFGFPTCPWCRNMIEPLFKVANDNNLKVYYFNPKEIRTNNSATYQNLLVKFDKYLEEDENGNAVLYVPDVYFIKDGKIMGHHMGTVESQTNPYQKLTGEQSKELEDIFDSLAKKLK